MQGLALLAEADQQEVLLGINEAVSEEKICGSLEMIVGGPAIATFDLILPVHSV